MSNYERILQELGEKAICEAELMLHVSRRPTDQRDSWGVRALACRLLRDRYCWFSWEGIGYAVYGRWIHTTAIYAANRWTLENGGYLL
jgi:hypothetical protein